MSTFRLFIRFVFIIIIVLATYAYPVFGQPACPVNAAFSPEDTTIFQNTNVTFRNQSTRATTYKWYVNNKFTTTSYDLAYNFSSTGAYTIKLIAANGTCTSEKIFTVVVMQQCYPTSFQKILHSSGNENITQVYSMPDESMLIIGNIIRVGRTDKDALMIRLDRKGKLLWAKCYGGWSDDSFENIS